MPLAERIAAAHYFIGACDWWVVEYDPAKALAFGYACLGDPQCAEWGYLSLVELEGLLAAAANMRVAAPRPRSKALHGGG